MDKILHILNYQIYDGITVAHIVGLVIALVIARFIWKALSKKERPDVYQYVQCVDCGWKGEVSKYHRVCKKCGGSNLRVEVRDR